MSQSPGPSYTCPKPFVVDARIERIIAGAVAEIDPRQIAILRKLTPAQRFQQAVSMIHLAERVSAYRLRLREPELSEDDALRIVRSGDMFARELRKQDSQRHGKQSSDI